PAFVPDNTPRQSGVIERLRSCEELGGDTEQGSAILWPVGLASRNFPPVVGFELSPIGRITVPGVEQPPLLQDLMPDDLPDRMPFGGGLPGCLRGRQAVERFTKRGLPL